MAALKREPVFKLAYQCSKPQCGAWRWRAAADARGEHHCTRCLAPFAPECIYKEVPQRKPAPTSGHPGRGAGRGGGRPRERPPTRTYRDVVANERGPIGAGAPQGGGGHPGGGKSTSRGGGKGGGTAARNPPPQPTPASQPKTVGPQRPHLPQQDLRLHQAPPSQVEVLHTQYVKLLELFHGDSENVHVVIARQELEGERARLESLKTPQEKIHHLDQRIAQVRNSIGNKVLALDNAHREAQEAQHRVDQLEGELQACLSEATELEVQQDKYRAQMPHPHPHTQVPQEETPEMRECANIIAYLTKHGGNTSHTQQTINECQDRNLRLAALHTNAQAVQEDSLEHGLPEDPPRPLQEGSPIRQTIITQGSLGTQRHVANYVHSKGKSAPAKGRRSGKGKGFPTDARTADPRPEETPAPPSTTTSASSTPATPDSTTPPAAPPTTTTPATAASRTTPPASSTPTPPWRENASIREEPQDQPSEMADANGPERGAKRTASSANADDERQQEAEDEWQEAARYRRGDGHLV